MAELPDKPEIPDMPPEEGDEPIDEELQPGDIDFIDHTRAEQDNTIDNEESETYPDE